MHEKRKLLKFYLEKGGISGNLMEEVREGDR
jgi:hypothetical protein